MVLLWDGMLVNFPLVVHNGQKNSFKGEVDFGSAAAVQSKIQCKSHGAVNFLALWKPKSGGKGTV